MRKKTKILIAIFTFLALVLVGLLYYRYVYYPSLGQFGVITNPVEAEVYINDDLIGKSPVEFQKKAGKYQLKVIKEGYQEYTQEIEILPEGFDISGILLLKDEEE